MRHVFSTCSEIPPQRLPSVDCAENASAPVMTADVVMRPARFTPMALSRKMM
jgi:hypothetical protein